MQVIGAVGGIWFGLVDLNFYICRLKMFGITLRFKPSPVMKRICCLLLVCLFPLLCVGQGVITRNNKTAAPPKQIKRQSQTDKSTESKKSDKKDNMKASSAPKSAPKQAENKTDAAKEATQPQDKLEKSASSNQGNSNSPKDSHRLENGNVGNGRNIGNTAGIKKDVSKAPDIKKVTKEVTIKIPRNKLDGSVDASKPETSTDERTYSVLILKTDKKYDVSDPIFKGYSPIRIHEQNGKYVYTYGETKDTKEIYKIFMKISPDFPSSYVISTK